MHLYPDDDATEDMVALGALSAPKAYGGNVIPLHGSVRGAAAMCVPSLWTAGVLMAPMLGRHGNRGKPLG